MKLISGKDTQKEKLVEDIVLSNYNRYYRLAYSYVHNDADACDIVQTAVYHALRGCHSLKHEEFAATWVYRIVLNEIFRFCNRKETRLFSLEQLPSEQGKEDVYENIDLQHALELLPPKDRAVVELRFFEDRKLEDIAGILEENVNTIKSRLYRSMKKLRLTLED